MVRDVSYAYSILAFAYRRALAASMRSRNAVRAVGGARLTFIHEYRISCNRIEKGGLDQYGTERFGRLILPQSEKVWH